MGNSTGTSSERRTLDYFEKLPRSARIAVANARFNWALKGWLQLFNDGKLKAADLVKRVEDADKTMTAKERLKVWGPDYPILKGELPNPRPAAKRRA